MNQDDEIRISLKIMGRNRVETITAPLNSTTEALTEQISNLLADSFQSMKIIYRGRTMKPGDTLRAIGIESDTTLHVMLINKKPASSPSDDPLPPPSISNTQPDQSSDSQANPPQNRDQQLHQQIRVNIAQLQKYLAKMACSLAQLNVALNGRNAQIINDQKSNYINEYQGCMPQILVLKNILNGIKFITRDNSIRIVHGSPFDEVATHSEQSQPESPATPHIEEVQITAEDVLSPEEKQVVENDARILPEFLINRRIHDSLTSTNLYEGII